MQKIIWHKEGNVYVAQFFCNGIEITAELSPDRTAKAVASQIGIANNETIGAALRLPDGRWFHPVVYLVDRARVHLNSGMNKDRALANAWKEEREAADRFIEAEKGMPHLRLLTVVAKRGTFAERKEIGGLSMPISFLWGPCDAYNKIANEMAGDLAKKVIRIISDLTCDKAA